MSADDDDAQPSATDPHQPSPSPSSAVSLTLPPDNNNSPPSTSSLSASALRHIRASSPPSSSSSSSSDNSSSRISHAYSPSLLSSSDATAVATCTYRPLDLFLFAYMLTVIVSSVVILTKHACCSSTASVQAGRLLTPVPSPSLLNVQFITSSARDITSTDNNCAALHNLCIWLIVNLILSFTRCAIWILVHSFGRDQTYRTCWTVTRVLLNYVLWGLLFFSIAWHIVGIVFARKVADTSHPARIAVMVFAAVELVVLALLVVFCIIIFFCAWHLAVQRGHEHQGATQEQVDKLPLYRYKKQESSGTGTTTSSPDITAENSTSANTTTVDEQQQSGDSGGNGTTGIKRIDVLPVLFQPQPQSCVICLSDYEPFDLIRVLPCSSNRHAFHKKCIDEWLLQNCSCPICRDDPFESKSNTQSDDEGDNDDDDEDEVGSSNHDIILENMDMDDDTDTAQIELQSSPSSSIPQQKPSDDPGDRVAQMV